MNTKKAVTVLSGALFLVLTALSGESPAELNVNIGITAPVPAPVYVAPPPPAYAVAAPPPVVVIPGTYVYYVPGITVDILFYHGYWYRPHGDHWYRASSYNGPWAHIGPGAVPRPLVALPHDYKRVPPGRRHIPYGQLKKNWAKWERDRHWDRGNGGHEGRGHDEDRDRGRGGHKGR